MSPKIILEILSMCLGLSQICFQEFPKVSPIISVFLLCLHYAPKLTTFAAIMLENFNQ